MSVVPTDQVSKRERSGAETGVDSFYEFVILEAIMSPLRGDESTKRETEYERSLAACPGIL